MTLFPPVPEDLSGLTDEQLQEHNDAALAAIDAVADGTADIGDLTDEQVLEQAQAAVAGIEAVRAEQTHRVEAAESASNTLENLRAQAHGTEEPADEPAATEDEPVVAEVVEEEPVAVVAAAPTRTLARRAPARTAEHTPIRVNERQGGATITAAAEGIGFAMGDVIPSNRELAQAMLRKMDAFGNNQPNGVREDVSIARLHGAYSSDRQLTGAEGDDYAKVMAVAGPDAVGVNMAGQEALVAAGGLCAPVQPYYDLALVSETMRPVRDSLPGFQATRGGIRFMAPPTLASITTAIGRITAAQDGAGGTNATKTCQTIACPSQTEVDVAILYHCLRFGNLGTRAWPEQVEQAIGLTMAAWSRLAETALLDGIAAASTAVTAAGIAGGANSNLLVQIIEAAAGQRNRHRMDPRRVLRALLPAWSIDLLVGDLIRSQFGRFDMGFNDVIAFLRTLNIAASFYVDGPTGGAQVFGAQGAGALLAFPTTVVWFLFPEGSFLYLDGGTLDLGVVRDSTLNSTNDYTIFGEGFENVAFIGVESLKVTSTVCASGAVTAPLSVTCPIAA